MARIPIQLSESEQAIVASERDSHPDLHVRRKKCSCSGRCIHGSRIGKQARSPVLARATVQRYLATYRADGLDGLQHWNVVAHQRTWPITPTKSKPR